MNASNRLGLNYASEARTLAAPPCPIIDVHTHINGPGAASVYKRAAQLYGIALTYSQTALEQVPAMREVFGQAIRFVAVPNWAGQDKKHDMGKGFIERIEKFHALGCRIVKFWSAPRAIEMGQKIGDPYFMRLSSPSRLDVMQAASDLGMAFMTHVADPDTWFASKYADTHVYGTKLDQYKPLEEMLDRFTQPWIAAHMGGWPEDLDFLAQLLQRHPNLYLDTSAAKWMIREISKHPREGIVELFTRFKGRILFGSDIVTMDEHLAGAQQSPQQPAETAELSRARLEMAAKASSAEEAFDLYASRYWALRKLWESDYVGPSPIADPDLHMVDPTRFAPSDAPTLVGKKLPAHLLQSLYHDAAAALLDPLHE